MGVVIAIDAVRRTTGRAHKPRHPINHTAYLACQFVEVFLRCLVNEFLQWLRKFVRLARHVCVSVVGLGHSIARGTVDTTSFNLGGVIPFVIGKGCAAPVCQGCSVGLALAYVEGLQQSASSQIAKVRNMSGEVRFLRGQLHDLAPDMYLT